MAGTRLLLISRALFCGLLTLISCQKKDSCTSNGNTENSNISSSKTDCVNTDNTNNSNENAKSNSVSAKIASNKITSVINPTTPKIITIKFATDSGIAWNLVINSTNSLPPDWSTQSLSGCNSFTNTGTCILSLAYNPQAIYTNQTLNMNFTYIDNQRNQKSGTINLNYSSTNENNVIYKFNANIDSFINISTPKDLSITFSTDNSKPAYSLKLPITNTTIPKGWKVNYTASQPVLSSTSNAFTCDSISNGSPCVLALNYTPSANDAGSLNLPFKFSHTNPATDSADGETIQIPYSTASVTPSSKTHSCPIDSKNPASLDVLDNTCVFNNLEDYCISLNAYGKSFYNKFPVPNEIISGCWNLTQIRDPNNTNDKQIACDSDTEDPLGFSTCGIYIFDIPRKSSWGCGGLKNGTIFPKSFGNLNAEEFYKKWIEIPRDTSNNDSKYDYINDNIFRKVNSDIASDALIEDTQLLFERGTTKDSGFKKLYGDGSKTKIRPNCFPTFPYTPK